MTARQSNLLGALVLALGDRIASGVTAGSGRAGQAPAALAVLAQEDGLGIEGLRRQLALSQSATVRLVDALVADGLARRRGGADARSITIELNAAGRRAADRVLGERRAVLDGALAALTARERQELEALLGRMLAGLTADVDEGEVICRLCDLAACPQARCPITCAVGPRA